MSKTETPHRPPAHRGRWMHWLLVSQVIVVTVWWLAGWIPGLVVMLLSHAFFVVPVFLPNSGFYAPVVSRWAAAADRVWLTIDDGPSEDTPALLALLARHGAKATFFVVGERAAARPDLVRAIVQAGHSLGNHSHSHPQARFWALGPAALRRQVDHCQQVLASITGQAPRWYRSVVGHTNPFVAPALAANNLVRVGWSARGFDGVECEPERVLSRLLPQLQPGAVVLLHEGGPAGQAEAVLAGVLDALQVRGLRADIPG